ncbi:MAG: hypothetical protein KIS62_12275 [Ramlibacter sp.]|nr:hypothetical protein [Ramlibacter sp.]
MREVTMPAEQVEPFFDAVMAARYTNHRQGGRKLLAAWPPGADWPNGRAFLLQDGETDEHEMPLALMLLLLGRLAHVGHRMSRNDQIGELLLDDRIRKANHIMVNRHERDEHAHCGRGSRVVLPLVEGLRQMLEPACAHPACRCTFDLHRHRQAWEAAASDAEPPPGSPPKAPAEPPPDDYMGRYYRSKEVGWIVFGMLTVMSWGWWGLHKMEPDAPWSAYVAWAVGVLLVGTRYLRKGELAAREEDQLRLLREIRDQGRRLP